MSGCKANFCLSKSTPYVMNCCNSDQATLYTLQKLCINAEQTGLVQHVPSSSSARINDCCDLSFAQPSFASQLVTTAASPRKTNLGF